MTVNEMIDNAWLSCQIGSKVMNVFANDGMLLVTADINPMDATTLQCRIDRAFRKVSRPATFTTCRCDECTTFDALLHARDHLTLAATDVGMSLCLMSPEGLTYWTPALVSLCLRMSGPLGATHLTKFRNRWSATMTLGIRSLQSPHFHSDGQSHSKSRNP